MKHIHLDKYHNEIKAGMKIVNAEGKIRHVVTLADGSLGYCITNPDFLKHYPLWEEEFCSLPAVSLDWEIVNPKRSYTVSVRVDGRIDVTVEAESFAEARRLANLEVGSVDFNRLECIEWDAVNAERDDGKFIDY